MSETSTFDKQRLKRIAPDALAIAVLVGFLVCLYWDFLRGRCFIWDDALTEFYPGVNYFAKSLAAGRFPLWFPGIFDGIPFYSDPQSAVFYLPQWLLIPFVHGGRLPFLVYQGYIVLHYLLGGLLMYLFLKELKLSVLAALSGAVIFCFSGFASLRIVNFVMIQVYVWLPLQLLCVHRLTVSGSRWAWLGLMGGLLMSLLAGHPQTTLYCWYLVIAYWLYRCYMNRLKDGHALRRLLGIDLTRQAATFALVIGIAAVMVLPVLENWRHSLRPSFPFQEIADPSLPYRGLLTLFVPNFFGTSESAGTVQPVSFWGVDPRSPNVLRTRTIGAAPGYWQYWEFGVYGGQIFWLAVLLILFNWPRVADKRMIIFFLVAWTVAIWFMLGRYGGLFNLAYYFVPGTAMFRGPTKMSCVATFAAAMLIAYGVGLAQQHAARSRVWPLLLPAAVYGCVLLALFLGGEHFADGLRNPKRLVWARRETLYAMVVTTACAVAFIGAVRTQRRWLKIVCLVAVIIFSFADLRHAYGGFHSGRVSPDEYYPESSRLLPLLKEYREQRGPFRFGQIIRGKIGEEIATFRNLPYFHDFLEVPEGYASFYLDSISKFQGITNEEAKIAIQNIRVTMERDEQGKDWLGTRTNSFPRAKFFSQIRHYDSQDALRRALGQGEFDWRNEAAVCDVPGFVAENSGRHGRPANTNDTVEFESIAPESYSVAYNLSQPGIVFVSESFYPGWKASDEHVKLTEVFGAFQGIVIPEAGSGRVEVHFSPPVFRLGIAITFLSLVITSAVVWLCKKDSAEEGNGVTDGI